MASTNIDLAVRIRELRKSLSLTQQELARELDVTPQHISRLEIGQAAPSLELLVRLSRRLGVSVDYLLTGDRLPVMDVAGAIRAQEDVTAEAKRALLTLIAELEKPVSR